MRMTGQCFHLRKENTLVYAPQLSRCYLLLGKKSRHSMIIYNILGDSSTMEHDVFLFDPDSMLL